MNIFPPAMPSLISRPEDRVWHSFVGERIAIRIDSAQTGGAYSIVEGVFGPASGPPLHVHQNEDEIIEVAEGRLRFVVGGESFDAGAGTVVVVPRGVPHTWRNLTDAEVRVVGFFTPGGLERMFDQFAGREPDELEAIALRHGTVFVGPRLEA